MGYLIESENAVRMAAVRKILEEKNLDLALVYYDEFNIGNGWSIMMNSTSATAGI